MKEIKGDIFAQKDADAICVTTNGVVKNNGELVMGRGIALEFAKRFPGLAFYLGQQVRTQGNHVHCMVYNTPRFLTNYDPQFKVGFPTKERWQDPSPLWLIERSARELVEKANYYGWTKVVLPRPGCGLGGLRWEQVRPVLASILDDRFYVITQEEGK